MEIDRKALGRRIRSVRKNKGLTLEEFGKIFEKPASKGVVSNWESGKNIPNNVRLKEIADFGEVSIVYLLYGTLRSYAHERITQLIEELEDYEFTDETKRDVINSAVDQTIKSTFPKLFYEIGEFTTVDGMLLDELNATIKRMFTKTEFTNSGLLKYSSSEISAIKSGVDKYLMNGVDREICNDIQKILSRANNEIVSLHTKHKDKLK